MLKGYIQFASYTVGEPLLANSDDWLEPMGQRFEVFDLCL